MTPLIILIVVAVLVLFYFVGVYNKLVRKRTMMEEGWSGIDVQLKKRHNLIPNLVETVKGYAKHEQETLNQVITARNSAVKADGKLAQSQAENQLQSALANVFALSEAYPDLKANTNFLQLQDQLADIENKIAASRRFYNNAAQEYNTSREQFPAVLIAGPFGFSARDFFEAPEGREALQEAPVVDFDT